MTEGDGDPRWLRLVRRPAPWLIVFGGAIFGPVILALLIGLVAWLVSRV